MDKMIEVRFNLDGPQPPNTNLRKKVSQLYFNLDVAPHHLHH